MLAVAVQAQQAADDEGPAFSSGAILDVNGDADSLIDRAMQYISDEQYSHGLELLQHVAIKYGAVLTSRDDRFYEPARLKVHRILASLPEEGLALYRLTADGEARGVLGVERPNESRDAQALRQVVRQYFVSSIGDDAAYALGCLLLDRYDYLGARRMFRKVLNEHPDPTVNLPALWLRLGVASVRIGDVKGAREAYTKLQNLRRVDGQWLALLEREIDAAERRGLAGDTGTPGTGGGSIMPNLREGAPTHGAKNVWARVWSYTHQLKASAQHWGGTNSRVYIPNRNQRRQSRSQLVGQWKKQHWLPTARVAWAGDRVLFKTHDKLVCADAVTGEIIWKAAEGKAAPDSSGRYYPSYYNSQNVLPTSLEEIMLFGDRIAKSISVIDGVAFQIEGHRQRRSGYSYSHVINNGQQDPNAVGGSSLAAIDVRTGKLLWRAGRKADLDDPIRNVEFLGAPVKAGDYLIVPLMRGEELCLAALDPQDGHAAWVTFLCTPPAAQQSVWAPVAVVVDRGDAYVGSADGVLFAVDLSRGELRWAQRYLRDQPDKNDSRSRQRFGWSSRGTPPPKGWYEDALYISGSTLVVLPGDAERIMLIDRGTGNMLANNKVNKPSYALGVHDGALFYVASDQLTCLDLAKQKPRWRAPVAGATGRAALTAENVFVPHDDKIVQLQTRTGKRLASVRVLTPRSDPVGNVFCNGEQLVVMGMERAYGVLDGQVLLTRMTKRIETSPTPQAYLARATLNEQIDRVSDAVADLRLAVKAKGGGAAAATARQMLISNLLAMADRKPNEASALLDEAEALAKTKSQQSQVAMGKADHLARGTDPAAAVAAYLALASDETDVLVTAPGSRDANHQTILAIAALQQLTRLSQQYADQVGPLLSERGRAALTAAQDLKSDGPKYRALVQVTRMHPRTIAAHRALVEAAAIAPNVGQFERTEAMLTRQARSSDEIIAAHALVALGTLYESRNWPDQAHDTWTQLAHSYADTPIQLDEPVEVPAPAVGPGVVDPAAPAPPADHGPAIEGPVGPLAGDPIAADPIAANPAPAAPAETGRSLAQTKLQAMADHAAKAVMDGLAPPPWKRLWHERGYGHIVMSMRDFGEQSRFLRQHMLVVSQQSNPRMICREAGSGKVLWEAKLPQATTSMFRSNYNGTQFGGGASGHILVLPLPDELVAFSLVTGKRLWSESVDDSSAKDQNTQQVFYSYTQSLNQLQQGKPTNFAAGDGLIVRHTVDSQMSERVEARDAATGQLLWRRVFEDRAIDGVRIACGAVIISCDNGAELMVCDRATGRKLGDAKLADRNLGSPAAWLDEGVVYQDRSSRRVQLVELPSGKVRWTVKVQNYAQFRPLNDHLACLIESSQQAQVIDIHNGKVLATVSKSEFGRNIQDVGITRDGKELFCTGYNNRSEWELSIIDLATSKRKAKIAFGRMYGVRLPAQTLADAGDLIPWVTRQKNANGSYTSDMIVEFYRKSDGKKFTKHTLPTPKGKSKISYMRSPLVFVDGVLVVSTNEGLMAFAHDDKPKAPEDAAIHEVQPGETLAALARKYYNDDKRWKEIAEANKQQLPDPSKLKVGMKLIIPGVTRTDGQTAEGLEITTKNGVRIIHATADTPFEVIVKELQKGQREGVKVEVKLKK